MLYKKDITESTLDDARALVKEGNARHGDVIVAGLQKKGRGRRSNTWDSPKGNLYYTIILKKPERPERLGFYLSLALFNVVSKILFTPHPVLPPQGRKERNLSCISPSPFAVSHSSPSPLAGEGQGEGLRNNAKALRKNSTDCEKKLWYRLRNNQLGSKFRRQVPFDHYIPDFVCPEKKIIVELDGGQHQEKKEYDAIRTNYFKNKGYRVLRFWNSDVLQNVDGVLQTIKLALETPHPAPLPQGEREVEKKHPEIKIKWPNDLLVSGGKAAGILIETEGDFMLAGIGVNIVSCPANSSYPTARLIDFTETVHPDDFSRLLTAEIMHVLSLSFSDVLTLWREQAAFQNLDITVRLPDRDEHGIFRGVDDDGFLLLERADGDTLRIMIGDVFPFPSA